MCSGFVSTLSSPIAENASCGWRSSKYDGTGNLPLAHGSTNGIVGSSQSI